MRTYCTKTEIRNQKLYAKYEEVLNKYGEVASKIKKQTIYDEVADEFNITWELAARIINKMTKQFYKDAQDQRRLAGE
jgi:hypothetical protein